MKKKFLSILLAISFVFGMGMFFVGCSGEEGEDQEKLHENFRLATSAMSSYRESVTYIYESDLITEKATYNNTTKEFAYLKYSTGGTITSRKKTKIFDNDIAYYSKEDNPNYSRNEEKVVDNPYFEKLVNDEIFANFLDAVNIDYSGYKAQLEARVAAGKAGFIDSGYTVTKATYKIEYKTLAENKYNSKVIFCYEYEKMNSGTGRKLKDERITSINFSDDWIFSVEENDNTEITYYAGGEVERFSPSSKERTYSFSKAFDDTIYATWDLSNKTSLPTQVEQAKLKLAYSAETIYEFNVDFNIGLAELTELAKEYRNPGEGTTYEFYLDAEHTILMPEDYQLNTQKENTIYVKTVIQDGYTQVTQIYQDSQGIRGTKTNIFRLNSEITFNNTYDGKIFEGQVYVDGEYTSAKSRTFTTGKTHTILYLADYNTDMLTETEITFYIKGTYHIIPEGTPSEQTLGQYFNKNEVKVYGVNITNSAFNLEIKTYDNTKCSLDNSLEEIQAGTYTVTPTIKVGYVVVDGEFGKSVETVNKDGLVFKFNKSQRLKISVNGVVYDYEDANWSSKVGIYKYPVFDPDGNPTVKLSSFKSDAAYYIYIV